MPVRTKPKRSIKEKEKRVSLWERAWGLARLYRLEIYLSLGLIAAVVLVFGQAAGFRFLSLDDDANVYNNPFVKHGFSLHALKWAFTAMQPDYWRPLIWLSHLLDVQLFGLNPGGHHLTNVVIHALNALLLFVILRRMTGAVWRSAAVAALFALHPLRAESVAWVTERKDVLSGLFWWLTTWAYVEYARNTRSWKRYWLVIAAFVLALMAKPTVITLPFFLLLLDYWPLKRLELAAGQVPGLPGQRAGRGPAPLSLIREKLPLFILSAVSVLATFRSQHEIGTMEIVGNLSFPQRLSNAMVAYAAYLYNAVWPVNLAAIYPYNRHLPAWEILASALLLVAVTLLVLWKAGRFPYLPVGWFWYLGVLFPVVGLVQMGYQARADRFTYIPLVGIFVLAVWGLNDLISRWRHSRAVAIVLAVLVFPALGVRAWSQVSVWRDNLTLFRENVRVTPDNQWALNALGVALTNSGEYQEAVEYFARALRLDPEYWVVHDNLGTALNKMHRTDEAIASFQRCLGLASFQRDLRRIPVYAYVYNSLAGALVDEHRWDEAVANYSEAIRVRPDYAEAWYNRSAVLLETGRMDEARRGFERALELGVPPELTVLSETDLGVIAVREGKIPEALPHFFQALRLDPGSQVTRKHLMQAIVNMGATSAAVQALRTLLSIVPDADVREYLNAILAQGVK